jgi:hypothetical protein
VLAPKGVERGKKRGEGEREDQREEERAWACLPSFTSQTHQSGKELPQSWVTRTICSLCVYWDKLATNIPVKESKAILTLII